jgi:uncharacterized membrane protein YphA (DoxX/SURF4 family)
LADYRRQLGAGAVIALVLLRLAIGWHFFREGLGKLAYDEGTRQYHVAFSAESFLAQAKGPWAANFRAWAPSVHDWVALLAVPKQDRELTTEEAAKQAKSQAEYNERQAQAEKSGGSKSIEFPPSAPYRDWATRIVEDWRSLVLGVEAIPGLSEEQRHQAEDVFAARVKQLGDYLATKSEAIVDNQHELWRLGSWRAEPEAADVPYVQKRISSKAAETTGAATPWVNQVREFEQKLIDDLRNVLTPEQKSQAITSQALDEALTSPEQARLQELNVGVTVLTIGVGACLLLGFFTRLASLAGAVFLAAVVATQPPWVADSAPTYNQVVELAALLVLAATGAGRWFGVDYLTYKLFSRSHDEDDDD